MREIKFRGQDFYTGEWRYGSYNGVHAGAADVFIIYEKEVFDPVSGGFIDVETVEKIVKEETVGQYTGLKDRHGVEIYEGDITRFHTDEPTHWMQEVDIAKGRVIKEVVWHEGKFHLNKDGDVLNWHTTTKPQNLEVIGNIYENSELLNGNKK